MTTQTITRAGTPWRWLAGWALANSIGWAAGLFLSFSVGWDLQVRFAPSIGQIAAGFCAFLLAGLLGGAVLGLCQGVALGVPGVTVLSWAGASAAAYGLGLGLMKGLVIAIDPRPGFELLAVPVVLLPALLLAAAHALLLRRAVSRAGWWLVACTLGVMLALLSTIALGGEGREWFAAVCAGLVYTIVTGPVLAWLRSRDAHL